MELIIITGVSRGLGLALSRRAFKQQASVIGLGRSDHPELAREAKKAECTYKFSKLDLTDPTLNFNFEEAFLGFALNKLKNIVFIHNAAISTPIGLLPTLNPQEVVTSFAANLVGPVNLSMSLIKFLGRAKISAKFIYISSGAALRPIAGSNVYCMAKAGLEMLAKAVNAEAHLYSSKIESIGFRPGIIDTEMQTELRAYTDAQLPMVNMYKDFHDKKLLQDPTDVAELIFKNLVNGKTTPGEVYSVEQFK